MTQKGKEEESFWLKYQGGPPEDSRRDSSHQHSKLSMSQLPRFPPENMQRAGNVAAYLSVEEVMLCWLCGVTQRHLFPNRSQPWAEVTAALSRLVNNMGQGSLSGLEGKKHSRAHIRTMKLCICTSWEYCLACCFTWTIARHCTKLGQSQPPQRCGWSHKWAHNPVLIRKAKIKSTHD